MIRRVLCAAAALIVACTAFIRPLKVSAAGTSYTVPAGSYSGIILTNGTYNYLVDNPGQYDLEIAYAPNWKNGARVIFSFTAAPGIGTYSIYLKRSGSTTQINAAKYGTTAEDGQVRYYYEFWGNNLRPAGDDVPTLPGIVDDEDILYYMWGVNPAASYSADFSYTTDIAGTGAAAASNRDIISWSSLVDSAGVPWSEYDSARVQIVAVPGTYSGTDGIDVLSRTWQDFLIGQDVYTIADVPADSGGVDVLWSTVIDTVSQFTLSQLVPFNDFSSGLWLAHGWVYRARVVDSLSAGDWVTIYTSTSSGADTESTIINEGTTYNQTLVQSLQEIQTINSTVNNSTNYTYYIQGVPVDTDPQYTEPDSGGKPWWAYLLESIGKGIGSIVSGIGKLLSGIGDLFAGVFSGIPDIDLHFNEIGTGTILQGPEDVINALPGALEDLPESSYVVSWPGIEIMGVDFIPASSWDLNSISDSLGIDHSMIYLATDAFVWSSIIILIARRVISALRG